MAVADPVIRRATAADLPAVGQLGAQLVAMHHQFDPQRFMAARSGTHHGYASYLASQLSDPDVLVLVAEVDGAVVGYAYAASEGVDYMSLRGPAGVLHDVLVDPAQRGRGLGGLLLQAVLAHFRDHGVPRVVLSTAARNEGAQRLFARAGFRPTMTEMTRESDRR